jgi:hypothetical protein
MIRRWIIIWMTLLIALPLWAQKGMHVESLFGGRFKQDKRAVEVLIKGKELKKYHLTLFRSLTVTDAPALSEEIEALVSQDAASAVDKEVGTVGKRLYYGFYCFPARDKSFRYLFYRNTAVAPSGSKKPEVTVVYMEGRVTLEELKQLFK